MGKIWKTERKQKGRCVREWWFGGFFLLKQRVVAVVGLILVLFNSFPCRSIHPVGLITKITISSSPLEWICPMSVGIHLVSLNVNVSVSVSVTVSVSVWSSTLILCECGWRTFNRPSIFHLMFRMDTKSKHQCEEASLNEFNNGKQKNLSMLPTDVVVLLVWFLFSLCFGFLFLNSRLRCGCCMFLVFLRMRCFNFCSVRLDVLNPMLNVSVDVNVDVRWNRMSCLVYRM